VITVIVKMSVVRRAFLSSERRTLRTVHVQNDFYDGLAVMNSIYPLTGLAVLALVAWVLAGLMKVISQLH